MLAYAGSRPDSRTAVARPASVLFGEDPPRRPRRVDQRIVRRRALEAVGVAWLLRLCTLLPCNLRTCSLLPFEPVLQASRSRATTALATALAAALAAALAEADPRRSLSAVALTGTA